MAFTKAILKIYKDKKRNEKECEEFVVHFNPSEYSLDYSANYAEQSAVGSHDPIAQFISGKSHTLSMTLYFDTYTDYAKRGEPGQKKNEDNDDTKKEDVRIYTDKLISLVRIKGDLHTPPLCGFYWGSLQFDGYVESLKQTFTMFLGDGMPVRAKIDITFRSLPKLDGNKAQPKNSPDKTKQRVLSMDTQLWELAAEEYDDPGMWRVIAKANAIDNPRKVHSGMVVRLPAL